MSLEPPCGTNRTTVTIIDEKSSIPVVETASPLSNRSPSSCDSVSTDSAGSPTDHSGVISKEDVDSSPIQSGIPESPRIIQWFLTVGLGDTLRSETPPERGGKFSVANVFVPQLLSWTAGGDRLPPPGGIASLCYPSGVRLLTSIPLPIYFTFVSTGTLGDKLFGHCLTVFARASPRQLSQVNASSREPLYAPLCFTILSRKLHVEAEELLSKLYAMHLSHGECVDTPTGTRQHSPVVKGPQPSAPPSQFIESGCHRCTDLIASLCVVLEPQPGCSEPLTLGQSTLDFRRPAIISPLHPMDIPFDDVFRALSLNSIITLWTACLLEWQIVLHSSQLSLLHKTTEVLQSLLFPFRWVHTLIPVLPHDAAGCMGYEAVLHAPTPFIIGMPSSRWMRIAGEFHTPDTGCSPIGALILDIDRDVISLPDDVCLPALPKRVKAQLFQSLQACGVTSLALQACQWRLERLEHMDTGLTDVPLTPDEDVNISFASDVSEVVTVPESGVSESVPTPALPHTLSENSWRTPDRRASVCGVKHSDRDSSVASSTQDSIPRRTSLSSSVPWPMAMESGATPVPSRRLTASSPRMWYETRRAFFHAIASLLVDYRTHIVMSSPTSGASSQSPRVSFDAEGFVESNPKGVRQFLSQLISTAHFSSLVFSHHLRSGGAVATDAMLDEYEPDSVFLDAWVDCAVAKSRIVRAQPAFPLSPTSSVAATDIAEMQSVQRNRPVPTSGTATSEGDVGVDVKPASPSPPSTHCCQSFMSAVSYSCRLMCSTLLCSTDATEQ